MPVISVDKDPALLTMTVTSEFSAPVERVWQVWADPRQLERWWGPPTFPATFTDHEFVAGAACRYFMTGPEGERHHGWWRVIEAEAPVRLVIEDGFADDAGVPVPDMPVTIMELSLRARDGGGTTMVLVSTFPSLEAMEQMVAMGMDEGIRAAMGQIDDLLVS